MITDTTIIMGSGDPETKDSCPRCGGKVFEAEKMTGKFGAYHRQCFKCMKCKRPLDYQSLSEGPDQDVYCKNCYSYTHGHKAKANLHDSDCSLLQGEEGDADVCPRCQGRVFEAEKQIAKPGGWRRGRGGELSQGVTTASASPARSANTRWILLTSPTARTTR